MPDHPKDFFVVRGTEILPTDPPRLRLQKLARITLDSMVQFVGLLDAQGTVLEINKVALDAVGIKLSDVEGKPFWTTFWWQVSEEINQTLRESIVRAAQGEFVRWDTEIYGRAGGKETIIIDASLAPVVDDDGNVVFICAEGRDITEKKAQEREIAQKNIELQGLLERIRELDEIKTQFFANVSHELRTPLALILGPAQRLIDDDGTMALSERREAAQVTARNARMLLKHVNDLLDMSKLEAGKQVLDSDLGGARFQITMPLHAPVSGASQPRDPADAPLDRSLLDGLIEELRPGAAARQTEESAGPGSTGRTGKPRVLVVEDNVDMNRFINQSLAAHYEVISAFDGREGLEKALRFRPVLVISDIMMPNVSGVEMITEMRKLPELQPTPVLLLSAKADEQLMVKLLDDGAQDFIVKPFSEKDLAVRVRNLVFAQQARQEATLSLAREQLAREEAELQKQLLHSLFMQVPTMIVVLRGPDHVIELANPLVCQAWGHAEKDLLDRPLFDAMPELRDQVFPALLDRVYHAGVPHIGRETPAKLDRGEGKTETIYFNFVYSPFRGIDGRIEGIFVVASDVTAQVLSREQVDGLREAAENANRAKDEFLAMLGHELRNPLSPIVTALQLMKLQGPEGAERARTVIERQVNHLIRLVDDLLDVSRIARGKVELRTEMVEMAEVVAKAIEMASPLLDQRAHTLTVDVPRRGLRVDGDPIRLSQVVSNLLTNAAKYTPPGGHITVRAEHIDDQVVLRVSDTGLGIAPDVLPHIFDLFVQERQAIDRSQGGLGLGLTIVRNLIERHGGSVLARSEGLGHGSEFVVRLPRASGSLDLHDPLAAPASEPEATAERDSLSRILVVDDNEDAAEMLAKALTRKGYETRVAYDAPTALRVAAAFMPDIALIDIGLPVMDGYELASHLRKIPGLSGLRLIAVTGYGQESDHRKTLEAGFDQHLVKPVDIAAIEAAAANRA